MPQVANQTRANIDAALLAQLQAAYNWAIPCSMHFRPWDGQDKVDATDQPCLFLRRPVEDISQTRGYTLNKYVFDYEVWVYARVDSTDPTTNPYDQLDPILDALDLAINGSPAVGLNNLSGLVDNCRISGKVFLADGTDNGQAVIRVPVLVITGT